MNAISVSECNGNLVVDSRLIADRLGIDHKNFLETVKKYQAQIEQRFGQFAFETETVENSVGAVNQVKFALLTEPQATTLMTFSRNTEQVVECKLALVEAFEKAKSVIRDHISTPQPLPTTHLELTVTLGQEMVKLERKVNEHSRAIAELKTTVTQLADAKVEEQIIVEESLHFAKPPSGNGLNPIVEVVEVVEPTQTKEQIRLNIERLKLEIVKERNRGLEIQIEAKKKGVSKGSAAFLKIVPPQYQTKILKMAEKNGGEVTVRQVQLTISADYRPSSQAMRECFKEVASLGYGTLAESGRTLKFHIGAEGRKLLESLRSDRAIKRT